jgi:hypothetical protein
MATFLEIRPNKPTVVTPNTFRDQITLTLMMEAACSSEMPVQPTTLHSDETQKATNKNNPNYPKV